MSKRNLEIDRLRALAIIFIIYCHFARIYFPAVISLSMQYGTTAVEIFFVISGFVISNVLAQKSLSIKAYYTRRIYRIYPTALSVFLFVLMCSYYFNAHHLFSSPEMTLSTGIYIATTTFNYFFVDHYHSMALAPYWTLAIEEQFYFLFPIFLMLTKNDKQRIYILIGMLLTVTFIFRPLTMHYYPVQGLFFSQTRCDGLIYGCLIYYLSQQSWVVAIKLPFKINKWSRCVCISLIFLLLINITLINFSINALIPLGALLASVLVLLASLEKQIIVFPSILQKLLDLIALRSYSLYLIHVPIFLLAKEWWDRSINGASVLIFLVMATEILYRLVEIPSLRMSKYSKKKIHDAFSYRTT